MSSSWLIVGAARGIGLEYVRQLAALPSTHVFAIIRSQSTAGQLNEIASKTGNVTVVETDIFDAAKLAKAVEQVSKATDGKLDYLVHNAYSAGTQAMMLSPTQFTGKQSELEAEINESMQGNIFGPIATINAFLPLIRAGKAKKIVHISTGLADPDFNRVSQIPAQVGYSTSKAAAVVLIAKYASELAPEGIKVVSLSPGWVATEAAQEIFTEGSPVFEYIVSAFRKVDPAVKGPIPTPDSVRQQLEVIEKLDAEMSGKLVSHHGDRNWF